jgi:hypothetical protein
MKSLAMVAALLLFSCKGDGCKRSHCDAWSTVPIVFGKVVIIQPYCANWVCDEYLDAGYAQGARK